jgi:hypothetical protein
VSARFPTLLCTVLTIYVLKNQLTKNATLAESPARYHRKLPNSSDG